MDVRCACCSKLFDGNLYEKCPKCGEYWGRY